MKNFFAHSRFSKYFPLLSAVLCLALLSACAPKEYDDSMANLDDEYKDMAACWGCTIFDALFNAINDIIEVLYIEMSKGAAGLLAIIFAFWIAFRVGKVLFTFKEPDTGEFWTDFTKMCFAVMFCGVILASKENMLETLSYTLTPLFQGTIDFAVAIIGKSFSGVGVTTDYSSCTVPFSDGASSTALDEGLKESMMCLIYKIHQRLTYGIFFAYKLMYLGFVEFLFALALLVVFYVMQFMFPFYMIDGIFRIGVLFVLFPLLVVFWPFKILRKYTTAGWKLFVGAIVHIMIMAIFVTLIIEIFTDFTALSVGTIDESEELLANTIAGPEAFLFMVFLGFYAWKFMMKTNLLAAQFSDSKADTSVFGKAITAMSKMTTNIAKGAASGGAGLGRKGIGALKDKIGGGGGGGK